MIKLVLLILINSLFIMNLNSQTKWEWSHPKGTGNDLFGFDFADDMTGYACGYLGNVIKTTDGGQNWFALNTGVKHWLFEVKCINKDTVIIVGQGSSIRTTNGGLNWNTFTISSSPLYDIYFLDNKTGFVAGEVGRVYKTTNSGWNWLQLAQASSSLLLRCYFYNEQIGMLTGRNCVYLTSNGGQSWNLQSIPYEPIENVEGLQIVDTNFICVVKNLEKKFYLTTNQGINWISYSFNLPNEGSGGDIPRGLYFKNKDSGLIITDLGRILKTTNGGVNWNLTYTTLNMYKIHKQNSKIRIAGKGGTMAYLDSNFNNLTVQSGGINSLNDMCVVNENVIYACGDRGDIMKTTNQGMSWLKLNSGNTTRLNGISFINENTGYVVGDSGLFYKTTNGGNNWNSVNNISGRILLRVHFFNENEGVVTGRGMLLLKTSNGGLSFDTNYSEVDFSGFTGLRFYNDLTGFASSARIFRTTNGGNNWALVGMNATGSGQDISILDSNRLISVSSIFIYRSSNMGVNWVRYDPPGDYFFSTCDYTLNGNLFMGSSQGRIYKSIDNGETVERYDTTFTNQSLSKIRFANANTGFIVGGNGIILKTTNGGLTSISSNNQVLNYYNINIFPNPVNPTSVLEVNLNKTQNLNIILYDITGREIRKIITGNLPAGVNRISIDLTSFSSGVYFCVVKSGDISLTSKKIVKLN